MCCGRNTAESCRKWSKSTGEYDYIDACWSSCALCSDDAYKILNTPIVYNEKIIDPEILLPLDAELLYYSMQSAKREQERKQQLSSQIAFAERQADISDNQQETTVPFSDDRRDSKELSSTSQSQEINMRSEISDILSKEKQAVIPSTTATDKLNQAKEAASVKSVEAKKTSQSMRKKSDRRRSTRKSSRSRDHSKKRLIRSRSRSK